MRYFIFILLVLMTACSAWAPKNRIPSSLSQTTWKDYLQQEILARQNLKDLFPDAEYLIMPWKLSTEVAFGEVPANPSRLTETQVNCRDKKLWPTHPQQSTKEYVYAVTASYDYHRLPGESEACITANYNKRLCVRSTWANIFIISDIYEDSCGNTYRGYWLTSFLQSQESMGTMVSKGRTVYPKPQAQFRNDYVTGYTYPLTPQDFLFLTSPWPQDLEKARRERTRALTIEGYKMNGKSFQPSK